MSRYEAAADILRCVPVSNDALAVGMAILAVADRVEALTDAVRDTRDPASAASSHTQPYRPAVVCPGCSTVHRTSSWRLCDTCASGRPA